MLRFPRQLAISGSIVTVLVALSAGLVLAANPTVKFDTTISPPTTNSFDISFVKNDIAAYVLADRANNAVDLFNAATPAFTGYIGQGGFVGRGPQTPSCIASHACAGPNGVLIDSSNHVWAADGAASNCSTTGCACSTGETTSMVKEYTLAPSTGATGRLACLDTGGKFRADELAFDPRDNLLIVANDVDGFLSLIRTSGTPAVVDQFFYADNDVGKPASARGLATPGGGIEQPVWNPQQGFFYQALPQGTTDGRVDVFNPKPGKLVLLRSISVPGCAGGPSGLAQSSSGELLGACGGSGVVLIDPNSGKVMNINDSRLIGADELWFDPGSNAWYVSAPGHLGIVSASAGHAVQVANNPAAPCCGHSVAAFTASPTRSLVFDPNQAGTGISVFTATTP